MRSAGALHAEAEGDVLGDRHMREDRMVLEHHGDVPFARGEVRHLPFADEDAAAAGPFEACDDAQKRGLAASGGTEQHQEFLVADGERYVLEDGDGAEGLANGIDDDG